MKKEMKLAIENYQCSGCINGCDTSCFEPNEFGGVGCGKHYAGTLISHIGNIFLGMPKGFNRLGSAKELKPYIFDSFPSPTWGEYNKFNIPVWKHLNEKGHTLVRGLSPRTNSTFLHIYLEDCRDKIDCLEISQKEIDDMD